LLLLQQLPLQELLPGCASRLEEDSQEDEALDINPPRQSEEKQLWIAGEQPLVYLARERYESCALLVLEGAWGEEALRHQLGASDPDGFTALHFAANLGQTRLVGRLLELKADVHATTRDVRGLLEPGGRTALHFSAAAGLHGIAKALLEAAADPSSEDWQGVTPFTLACRRGHFGLAKSLLSAGVAEVPSEQELSGLEVVEGMAVRERSRQCLSVEGRPELEEPFCMESLWTSQQCEAFLAEAIAAADLRGWQSTRHRHYPTVDIPACDIPSGAYCELRSSLDSRVLPEMQQRYRTKALRIKEAFFVKYEAPSDAPSDAPSQAGLDFHKDGTLLNCVVVLNDPEDFEGGGTVFAPPLDRTYKPGRGDCLCSCGQLFHGANQVTRGKRFVFIAFIEEQLEAADFEDEDD